MQARPDQTVEASLRKYAFDCDREIMQLKTENAELRKQLAIPPEQRVPSPPATDTSLHKMLEEHL